MTIVNPTGMLYTPPAVAVTTPANPTAPASTSAYKLQGLGGLITPQKAGGNVLAIVMGTMNASAATTAGNGMNMQLAYGPVVNGVAPPANTALLPAGAVLVGNPVAAGAGTTLTAVGDYFCPVTLAAIVKGLTPGQQYWFDVYAESITTASDNALINITMSLIEIG